MDIFGVISLFGGLAMFLYGMTVMEDGLTRVSGGRLESILEKMTKNRFSAVLLGAGVTAVIQSSSATTVMVVGFVNSGIMKLTQAVGVIMGANIGTTATAWLLSLAGISGSSVLVKLLNPVCFCSILALIGVFYLLFSKNEKKKDIALILIGFAVLMYGMETMSDSVAPLADQPGFSKALTMFSNPLLGCLAGALLTAVIQSSSASVGILQALSMTGDVTFATAFPIILGANIGTCVTAVLSAIGANKNAKRAAGIHLSFNIIGAAVCMALFYGINAIVHFSFMGLAASPAEIALVHSIFNITATVILFPFGDKLVKLMEMIIPDNADDEKPQDICSQLLDPRFLESPSLAVAQCRQAAEKMADDTKNALFGAIDLIEDYNKDGADHVKQLEDEVDSYEDALGSYMMKLSSLDLSEHDSRALSVMLHCIGDFERISDHAVNIAEAAEELSTKDEHFSKKALSELAVYTRAVKDVVDMSFKVFDDEDRALAREVEPLEEVIDYLNEEIKKRHIKRLRKGKCTIELGFILSDITTAYERVSDHCSNIAVCIIEVNDNEFDTHEYMIALKGKDSEGFEREVAGLQQKYVLPE